MMPRTSPLLTDLYQLFMLQAYWEEGLDAPATFEMFVRKLPNRRNFLMAAGLEQVVDFLETAVFTADEIDWLDSTGRFDRPFLDRLASFRFTGDVDALPEGTVFFPDEPLVRVTAPLPQAQLVETRLLNILHFQTLVASKAARMVLAAPGRQLIDFGLRRAHGSEAGLVAARAAYLAGFAGTATVEAGRLWPIPIFGTMAHSFIQAHDSEREAFLAFARSCPDNVTLLIDTYDTERAAWLVADIAPLLSAEGITVRGVRLDSGDLGEHARRVRAILDEGGLRDVRIVASGGLDENALAALQEAPIDGFGIGTSLVTSDDAPALDCAYKLQEFAGTARRKRSEGKATWPGRKQVFRRRDNDGRLLGDTLALESERHPGRPLLVPVLRAGRRVADLPGLNQARRHAAEELATLPPDLHRLDPAERVRPTISPALRELAAETDRRTGEKGNPR